MSRILTVSIQKALDGRDYLQILSGDQISVNIVLIADKVRIIDSRRSKS